MNEAAKAARREYKRKWAQAHPENVKRWQETYWNKKAAQAQAEEAGQDDSPGAGRGRDCDP